MASNNKLISAAIDFGTTYSGYALSFNHEYKSDPMKIKAKQWNGGHGTTMKVPTTILLQPDGKTLHSFGYEAETKYAELACEDKHNDWYYFRRFKMMLHGKMTFERTIDLEDETHKRLPAMKVFSMVIRYMKEDLLEMCRDQVTSGEIKEDDIIWVLTVPAIWDDAAKQFMREAAITAGINELNIRLALEPEMASMFCRLLPMEHIVEGGDMSNFRIGSKYMVLDAGGGTVDITVHEVMPDNKLKELHKASGGAWGGIYVDHAYKQFLIKLVGAPVIRRLENENKEDYLDIFNEFEIIKKSIFPKRDNKVNFRFPTALREIFLKESDEDISDAIKQTEYSDQVSLTGDKLRVDASVVKSFFSAVIQNIVLHIKELMTDSKVQGISNILMVGGFSESKMLQDAIKSNFDNLKIVIPHNAGLAVLKGAVVFGHSPNSIAERVCKYTYGVKAMDPFDERIHDIRKRIERNGEIRCNDCFSKHVEVGQTVAFNHSTEETSYMPGGERKRVSFQIFASKEKSPMYVTDEGCEKIGEINVDILDMTVPRKERELLVSMCFGGTEIEVRAREKRTGKITKGTVNFLG